MNKPKLVESKSLSSNGIRFEFKDIRDGFGEYKLLIFNGLNKNPFVSKIQIKRKDQKKANPRKKCKEKIYDKMSNKQINKYECPECA